MNEIWKTLVYQGNEYDNYEINEFGKIRNKTTKYILSHIKCTSGCKNKTPYYCSEIGLGKRGETKRVALHRALAETFIPNPYLYKYVLFKDGDYNNIFVENLYWSHYRKGEENHNEYIKKRKSNSESVCDRRRKLKQMAVEYKGNKCVFCGYNRCIGALEFHHINPEEKDFSIASSGTTKSWARIKEELDKCICVCANCHREIHNNIISVDEITKKVG